jgi:heme A synthase
MMTFNVVVAVILVYALVAAVFGPLPWKEWVRLAVFVAIGAVGWWRVTLLWREQRDARRHPYDYRGAHHLPGEEE